MDAYFWGKRATDEILSKRKTADPEGTPGTEWWHFVTDHQFSVRAVIDGSSRRIHERIEYDAYGVPKLVLGADLNADGSVNNFDNSLFLGWYNASDPRADLNGDGSVDFFDLSVYLGMYNTQAYGRSLSDANALQGPDNTIGYAGYHWDEELGMWLSRHRVYDPELGRWLQRDPAGYVDGMSLYGYVRGNPFSLYDPTGLKGTIVGNWFRDITGAVKAGGASQVAGGFVKGAGEGAQIAANTYTFGATDAVGLTDTSEMNEGYHNLSRAFAAASRDLAITATGAGLAQKGGQATQALAKGAQAYDKAQDVQENAQIVKAAATGDVAAVTVAVAGKVAGKKVADKAGANGQYRDSNGRLRNSNGTFAPDGGPKPRSTGGTHGNTAGDQPATLYERYDADGNFLKHGVTQDPSKRYTKKELDGGYLLRKETGPRKEMLRVERELVETNPGPLNKEPWAGRRSGE